MPGRITTFLGNELSKTSLLNISLYNGTIPHCLTVLSLLFSFLIISLKKIRFIHLNTYVYLNNKNNNSCLELGIIETTKLFNQIISLSHIQYTQTVVHSIQYTVALTNLIKSTIYLLIPIYF